MSCRSVPDPVSRGGALRVPVHRRAPGMAPGRAGNPCSHHRAPRRRPLMGQGGRQAQRHRAPHPYRRPVDTARRPPGAPGARTGARRRSVGRQGRPICPARIAGITSPTTGACRMRARFNEARRESPGSHTAKHTAAGFSRAASMRPGANRRDHLRPLACEDAGFSHASMRPGANRRDHHRPHD